MYIKIRDKKTKKVTTIRTQHIALIKELLKNLKNDDDIEIIKKIWHSFRFVLYCKAVEKIDCWFRYRNKIFSQGVLYD